MMMDSYFYLNYMTEVTQCSDDREDQKIQLSKTCLWTSLSQRSILRSEKIFEMINER